MTAQKLPFTKDFEIEGHQALTLNTSEVTDSDAESGEHTKTHPSGWTITGEIYEDYYKWVNDFVATHPQFGTVRGNFEVDVDATSEAAFVHFWKHHEPMAWDYWDI